MALYLVRVELFNANGDDYTELHDQLEARGLYRKIRADGGGVYDMPSGTYFGESELSTIRLQEWVSGVADPHSHPKAASVFVAQVGDWQSFLHRS
ncbi:hypothetical protein [Pseudomonas fluorescens]|uniref:DUF2622 domain-containing protein n=1 Tax=Pseudomonas fluorescens TaxID=294 RepID=A0A2N1E2W9_PSEFL|nr:hypothetical protein [Pseudomonas fluorescens]PKH18824.1 hypothetical protein CIB54_17200 [Pseudomonas fluorescens]